MSEDIDPERKFSNGGDWDNSIDWDDASDGSSGGYNIHGSPINPEAMKELVQLRMEVARLREALEGWQKWWALPWQDRRPDMADVCWKRSRIAIREGGKDDE